jgi:hypothetical protein
MDLLCVVRPTSTGDMPLAWRTDAAALAANLVAAVAHVPYARLSSPRPDHPDPARGDRRSLWTSIMAALPESGPGDVIYFVESDHLHRPESLSVLLEGLRDTDADYVTLYDEPQHYWCPSDRPVRPEAAGQLPVAVSSSCHWLLRHSLPGSFGARHATLERDLAVFARHCGATTGDEQWAALWAQLRSERGRVLRAAAPAFATSAARGSVAPCFPAPRDGGPPAVGVDGDAGFDLWRNADLVATAAVLPGVTGSCRQAVAALLPHVRQTAVRSPEQVAGGRFQLAITSNVEKERLDSVLRDRAVPIFAVIVDVIDPTTARSLRWISGRDWLLPGGEESPWVV